MDELDRRILRAIQDGLPLCAEPYAEAAREVGVPTEELLARLKGMLARGEVRRFGASIAHRNAGFGANVMCVWRIPPQDVEAFAEEAIQFDAITHCYDRPALEAWPYHLYAMIHGRAEEDCQAVIHALCERTGQSDYVALYSTREFKKTWTRI